jgi:hypothetical protein
VKIKELKGILKMAKHTNKFSLKGDWSKTDDGRYIMTEVSKDDVIEYDVTSIMDNFIGLTGVSFSIGIDDDVPSVRDE